MLNLQLHLSDCIREKMNGCDWQLRVMAIDGEANTTIVGINAAKKSSVGLADSRIIASRIRQIQEQTKECETRALSEQIACFTYLLLFFQVYLDITFYVEHLFLVLLLVLEQCWHILVHCCQLILDINYWWFRDKIILNDLLSGFFGRIHPTLHAEIINILYQLCRSFRFICTRVWQSCWQYCVEWFLCALPPL